MSETRNVVQASLTAINELEDLVANAKNQLFANGMKVVNAKEMNDRLAWLRDSLPGCVAEADKLLQEQASILAAANESAAKILADARAQADNDLREAAEKVHVAEAQLNQVQNQLRTAHADAERAAQQMVQNAQTQANQIVTQAQTEAQNIKQQADYQAQSIIKQANAEAEQLKSQEQVFMRAQVDAERLKSEAETEVNNLRQRTFNYVEGLLNQMEQYAGAIMTDVHQERESLSSQR